MVGAGLLQPRGRTLITGERSGYCWGEEEKKGQRRWPVVRYNDNCNDSYMQERRKAGAQTFRTLEVMPPLASSIGLQFPKYIIKFPSCILL